MAALLGLWSPNAWHPPEKHGSLFTFDELDEQAPKSNVPAIIMALARFEIMFSVPCGLEARACSGQVFPDTDYGN
ncbi:Uncharacterized protein PFLU_1600 [Pseudomonas [fluorescens] SBW25]|uniref:Uncharacterized protein n=1 Tax=Pseudomonas fluorescens (strain SBW25) TaxID=216595 RepID=C3K6I7_PSEFS|nr:Uncharacterized protein PFLU_1600 [Pseudomonas fluorescens SBW25]